MFHPSSKFIVIEGIDGAGKTTLIQSLQDFFKKDKEINQKFQNIIYTKEPGSSLIEECQQIRKLSLNKKYNFNNTSKILLFMTNRSEHIEKLIKPNLQQEKTLIICDRYYLSTLVYQNQESDKNIELIKIIQKFITKITPDITFLIHISQDTFLSRYKHKVHNNENDSLDDYVNKKFEILQKEYISKSKKYSKELGKIVNIDGDKTNLQQRMRIVKEEIMNLP